MAVVIFDWTPIRCAKLTELWHAGVTTSEIGRVLGCGKNSAIGKAARLGLPPRSAGRGGYVRLAPPSKPPKLIKIKLARAEPLNSGDGILLTDLTAHTCRWPMWAGLGKPDPYEARYCGANPEPSNAYCAGHMGLAIQAPK